MQKNSIKSPKKGKDQSLGITDRLTKIEALADSTIRIIIVSTTGAILILLTIGKI